LRASLGGRLAVEPGDDAIEIRLGVPAEELEPALAAVGAALRAPRFEAAGVEKARKRLAAGVADLLNEDGEEAAVWMLRRVLFSTPSGTHPYAVAGAAPGDLLRLGPAEVRAFHARTFAPAGTFVLIAGAIDPAAATAAAAKAFAGYGGSATRASLLPASPLAARRIVVVDRPKSERSEIFVGFLGPRPSDADAAAFAVLDRLLGTKGSGRLFMDVREQRSLAYQARTRTIELAGGPQVFAAYANTQAEKTGKAVAAILENLERIAKEAPGQDEFRVACRAAAGALAAELRTVGDVAGAVARLRLFGLPGNHPDQHRAAIEAVSPDAVRAAAARYLAPGREAIIVAGDADQIGAMLSRFGAVDVVDPSKGFVTVRRIDANPGASLDHDINGYR
jgi:zinc protease